MMTTVVTDNSSSTDTVELRDMLTAEIARRKELEIALAQSKQSHFWKNLITELDSDVLENELHQKEVESSQQALVLLARATNSSIDTNKTLLAYNERLITEIKAIRRDLILAPFSVVGMGLMGTLLYMERISEIYFLLLALILMTPFFPEAIRQLKRLGGNGQKSEAQ